MDATHYALIAALVWFMSAYLTVSLIAADDWVEMHDIVGSLLLGPGVFFVFAYALTSELVAPPVRRFYRRACEFARLEIAFAKYAFSCRKDQVKAWWRK